MADLPEDFNDLKTKLAVQADKNTLLRAQNKALQEGLDSERFARGQLERRVAELLQRRTELQQANNDYLNRAREAITAVKEALDQAEWWQGESLRWAQKFAEQRREAEDLYIAHKKFARLAWLSLIGFGVTLILWAINLAMFLL